MVVSTVIFGDVTNLPLGGLPTSPFQDANAVPGDAADTFASFTVTSSNVLDSFTIQDHTVVFGTTVIDFTFTDNLNGTGFLSATFASGSSFGPPDFFLVSGIGTNSIMITPNATVSAGIQPGAGDDNVDGLMRALVF